jgi:hypothetical protein
MKRIPALFELTRNMTFFPSALRAFTFSAILSLIPDDFKVKRRGDRALSVQFWAGDGEGSIVAIVDWKMENGQYPRRIKSHKPSYEVDRLYSNVCKYQSRF